MHIYLFMYMYMYTYIYMHMYTYQYILPKRMLVKSLTSHVIFHIFK